MSPPPKILSNIDVNLAGGGATMSVGLLGPLNIEIGDMRLRHPVYMAPLQDDMLIGIDFMQENEVQLHCGAGELRVGGSMTIQAMHKANTNSVQGVTVRRVRLPPLSVGVIDCNIEKELPDFILEPTNNFPVGVSPSRTFNQTGNKGKLCLINMTPRSHIFRAGEPLATALPAHEVGQPSTSVRQVSSEGQIESQSHIQTLLEDIRTHAPPEVREEALQLINEYADVFATSDLDLGNFDALEHRIETGTARPVKQRMRRTPAVFQGEEEGTWIRC
ncbi:uncharacterized protein LOC134275637 [Saccostrea cucullata]|uniref:uncharacterized protein LOC134275637 n=1 Tax=Saccostrea cuccullata TaxID=36930 RepID=UPI002ED68C90